MEPLHKALHTLRPLVESQNWDYCVVWKLGDDPSRFFEWVGCCCSGAQSACDNVKEVKSEEEKTFVTLCKDIYIKHFARTKACMELAKFPSSIPLYSGIRGETVISTEARWLSSSIKYSDSNISPELGGTRVLIPVVGGLVELFTIRNVPRDEKIIDFISSQCKFKMELESNTPQNYAEMNLADLRYTYAMCTYPSLEGSSTGSNPTHGLLSLDSHSNHVSPNASVNELLVEKHQAYRNDRDTYNYVELKNEIVYVVGVEDDDVEKEKYQSKNLITERKRRNRINDGLLTLRSLVPKISKMDKPSILVDAIAYIEELQKERKELEDELKRTTKDEENKKRKQLEISELNENRSKNTFKCHRDQSSAQERKQTQVQVEVNQIGKKDFLVKLVSRHKQGGFMRLIESMDFLGLQVIDANTTTFDGQMMNILKVEVNAMNIQPKVLKESLIKLSSKFC